MALARSRKHLRGSRLTNEQVAEIRRLAGCGDTPQMLDARYHVGVAAIERIIAGKTYRNQWK